MNQIRITSETVLGILGSGQLARMSALAAADLGIKTRIYCTENGLSPAESVATYTTKGTFFDLKKILAFVHDCDMVTLENEFIDQTILDEIELNAPGKLFPSARTFRLIGDKLSEKKSFEEAGLRVTPYKKVADAEEVITFAREHSFPVVLKSAKGGYDGYGNITIKNENEAREKFSQLKGELLAEAYVSYVAELAILIARNADGEMITYPVAHTMQENHICHFVSVPAEISADITKQIETMARTAMEHIDAVGLFAFEFFLTKDNTLYLNESAPRPHNSGHYSIEGCMTSQFHNHIRSVLNLPLGETYLRSPNVLMLNLLGTKEGTAELTPLNEFLKIKDGHLHLYGKSKSKKGRKMGHYTLLGTDKNEMFYQLKKLKEEYGL